MKHIKFRLQIILFGFLSKFSGFAQKPASACYQNFYGISWRGNPHENLAYAKQMRYGYVFYQKGMERDTLSNGLYFYLETPEYLAYNRTIDTKKSYDNRTKTFYENYCTLKNTTDSFPNNLATGWFFTPTSFTPILDFQQQKVIDFAVDSILNYAKAIEKKNPKFHFGGLAWDVPQPSGDFWDTTPHGKQVTLKHWTGGDYGTKPANVVHDFATYSEGHMQFYKQVYAKARLLNANARFIMEPYKLFEDWINLVKNRPDVKEVTPDLLSQESPGIDFVNDVRIFADGIITKARAVSTTPNKFSEADNRIIAANTAINGAWFTWYGRFGGTGDMPDYKNITEVPARLKLIRLLANYENINETPLGQRTWDGTTYKSNAAFTSPKAIGILQPSTNKYFVVFMTEDAVVPLPVGKSIVSISTTTNLLIENGDGSKELNVANGNVSPNNTAAIDKAYIIQLR